jgi:hypothetical protein
MELPHRQSLVGLVSEGHSTKNGILVSWGQSNRNPPFKHKLHVRNVPDTMPWQVLGGFASVWEFPYIDGES